MLMKRLGVDFSECLNQVAQYLGIRREKNQTTSYQTATRSIQPLPTRSRPITPPSPGVIQKAQSIWQSAQPASPDNPYLVKKKLPPVRLKQYKGCLVSALYNTEHQLVNLQFIGGDGQKRFLKGGQTRGCFQWWSPHYGQLSRTVYLCEGVADALATYCHFHQGRLVIAAYSVSNLIIVGQHLRQRLPEHRLIAVLDNDEPRKSRSWRPGAAALIAHNSFDEVILPPSGMDASDVWVHHHGE